MKLTVVITVGCLVKLSLGTFQGNSDNLLKGVFCWRPRNFPEANSKQQTHSFPEENPEGAFRKLPRALFEYLKDISILSIFYSFSEF